MNPTVRWLFPGLVMAALAAGRVGAALRMDDFESPAPGTNWVSFADPNSAVAPFPYHASAEGHASAHGARVDYELKPGLPHPFAGVFVSFSTRDVSAFEGVRFRVRGSGSWTCRVATGGTSKRGNHYGAPFRVTPDWTFQEVPFRNLLHSWGVHTPWVPAEVSAVQWAVGGKPGDKGWMCLDDVEFYARAERVTPAAVANPVVPGPKVDQGVPPGCREVLRDHRGPRSPARLDFSGPGFGRPRFAFRDARGGPGGRPGLVRRSGPAGRVQCTGGAGSLHHFRKWRNIAAVRDWSRKVPRALRGRAVLLRPDPLWDRGWRRRPRPRAPGLPLE